MTIEQSKNEALRKIGRNVMLFQQLEQLLKFIITNGSISGYASELESNQRQKKESIKKQTMGQLVGQYLKTTHSEEEQIDDADDSKELKEAFFSFKFQIESDAVYYETKKADLSKMVSERNELIHHILPRFDLNSLESCIELEYQLDNQREKIIHEINDLEQKIKHLQEGKKALVDFINSDEGKKQFELSWLRQTPLVLLLGDISLQTARPDGWTSINIAGQLIKKYAPEESALLKTKYGYKSLKALILATEIFDIYEELTDKGSRILYKLKPDWALSNA